MIQTPGDLISLGCKKISLCRRAHHPSSQASHAIPPNIHFCKTQKMQACEKGLESQGRWPGLLLVLSFLSSEQKTSPAVFWILPLVWQNVSGNCTGIPTWRKGRELGFARSFTMLRKLLLSLAFQGTPFPIRIGYNGETLVIYMA